MEIYQALLTDQLGSTSNLLLEVDVANGKGIMVCPSDTFNLIDFTKSEEGTELYCWIKLNYFNIKCLIKTKKSTSKWTLDIQSPYSKIFEISERDYIEFQSFVDKLDIPIKPRKELPENQLVDTDNANLNGKLAMQHISLFVASRPGSSLDIEISKIKIDGIDYQQWPVEILPGYQGIYIPVDLFDKNKKIHIEWEIKSGMVGFPQRVIVGIFRNFDIQNNTRMEQISVESFLTYRGVSIIIV